MLENAKGFAIFTIFKAGFLFSARAGSGIVIAKLEDGSESKILASLLDVNLVAMSSFLGNLSLPLRMDMPASFIHATILMASSPLFLLCVLTHHCSMVGAKCNRDRRPWCRWTGWR